MNGAKTAADNLRNPEYVKKYRPIPFWSWNDKLDKHKLVEQIEWMNSCGIGGFFMHARGGLEAEYLGKEWMECCDACCEKAAQLGMDAYMYDENGWPSGFVGGKLLEDEANRDKSLECAYGEYDGGALVSYEITPASLVRASSGKKGARYLNLYCKTAVSTVDVLNPEVVEKFLNLTHRKYKERYGDKFSEKIKGFFTDEPQYFRWGTPYTPMIAKYFDEVYGEDILDRLGLLFAEKDGYEDFRYKYWSGMRSLFLKNFAQKLYNFCEENNMALTGHYVEETSIGYQMMCCAGAMPYYMYEHIPGIDWLGRGTGNPLSVKQVGSVAAQTGRDRVLTETFGCCGWDVTPRELKCILDWQYVGGVNLMCHHLLPSSEYGQRKRDYPQHYTPLNPWIKHSFRDFNDTYTRVGALLGHSREVVDVCILHPVTSAYIDYKRMEKDFAVGELDKTFRAETNKLAELHIAYHYVDEEVLARIGGVDGDKLVCGECKYGYLVLPSLKTVAKSTLALIEKFVAAGGKLCMLGTAPKYVEGEKKKFAYKSNCTLADIGAAQPYHIDNPDLRSSLRESDDCGKFFYVINPTDSEQKYTLSYEGANSVESLDPETLTVSQPLPLTLNLRAGQSALLFPSGEKAAKLPEKKVVKLAGVQKLVSSSDNTLMLDSARFALDGGEYGESMSLIQIFALLLEKRYAGKLRLEYSFRTDFVPAKLDMYAEDMNTEIVKVNGHTVEKVGTLEYESKVWRYDIAEYVHEGENKIEITLDYYQSEDVYYALFGEGVTESLRNCMVYKTAIESIYLAGDFGVYPVSLRDGETEGVALCDGFTLGKRKSEVRSLIEDGFATFAGEITLESEIDCPKGGCLLEIGGRWQTAVAEVNGVRRKLLFDNAVDISDIAHAGKNKVRVTLTTSLRNLMGPHHFAPAEEPKAVGPEHFDLGTSWKDGKSKLFRASYSLVKTEF